MRLIDAYALKEKIRKAANDLTDCEGCNEASPECCRECFAYEVEDIINESPVFDTESVRHR